MSATMTMVNNTPPSTNTRVNTSTIVTAPVVLGNDETLTVAPAVTLARTGSLAVYQPPSVMGEVSVINQGTIIEANAAKGSYGFGASVNSGGHGVLALPPEPDTERASPWHRRDLADLAVSERGGHRAPA
jgi:hypothetical protein